MKKKIFSLLLILSIFIIPLKSAYASTHYLKYESTSKFTEASGGYYIGSYWYNSGSTMYYHNVYDNGLTYTAYCMDVGKGANNNRAGSITNGSGATLYNRNGTPITGDRLELLKNILAAGYQDTSDRLQMSYTSKVSSMSIDDKKKYLATQVLVWEVMEGARTGYDDSSYSSSYPNSKSYIAKDSNLQKYYNEILNTAKAYSTGAKPSGFGKTYTLHWVDGKGLYESVTFNKGDYNFSAEDPLGLTIDNDNPSNAYAISVTPFSGTKKINFWKSVGGTTNNTYESLRWFNFSSGSNMQKALIAYYMKTLTGDASFKVESGKFKITKKDSTTKKNLKGAVFDLEKCSSVSKCTKIKTIDLTDKSVSDEIEIDKSGLYKFKEVKVPFGYDKIGDFYVTLTIADDGKVDAQIDGQYQKYVEKNTATDTTILNINIYDEARYFNIKKVDGRNTSLSINGTSFQIKKDGTALKFTKESDGKYRYDANGTITTLKQDNMNVYSVSLLPAGEYVLEEIDVPYPYVLPSKQIERETKFKIVNDVNDRNNYLQTYNYTTNKYIKSADVTVTIKNFKTRVLVNKTGLNSKPVKGVVFELYDSNKTNQIKLRVDGGEYIYSTNGSVMQLVTNDKGQFAINYLPEGTYYLKEISTPADSGLSIDPDNQWTKIDIYVNRNDATPINYSKEVRNAKGTFCFYKIDEDGNYLDSGKFKLQVYNEKNAKYEDASLIFNSNNNNYSIDLTKKSDIYTFSPVSNGQTCFVDVDVKGKYRVVEIEAPEGFVLPKSSEAQAEITINEYGYATGDAVIINKKIKIGDGAEAQAELIINIQTGQNRVHYIVVICSIVLIITGLLIFKKKIDKK